MAHDFRFRPVALAAILLSIVTMSPALAVASPSASDSAETERERAAARTAELASRPGAPAPVAGSGPAGGDDGPLFVGVDDVAVPAWRIDVGNGDAAQAFSGFQVWGAAYDPAGDRVFFNSGATLLVWPVGGAVQTLGTVVDGGAPRR